MDLWRLAQPQFSAPPGDDINVCMGGDWYTFPSHFFLPSHARLQFVEDNFRGQLPFHFAPNEGTSSPPLRPFNDLNLEEPSHYVDLPVCHYLVVKLPSTGILESDMKAKLVGYAAQVSTKVLDAANSSPLSRAFSFPHHWIGANNNFNDVVLYRRIKSR